METLDHVERELEPETLLIADPAGPLGIAGVMGGATSEVSAATTDVIIESAIFDPVSIRRTAFRYALRSEASLRFEKGQEHRLARLGADRTARLIEEWAGGTVAKGVIDTNPTEPPPARVPFRPARVSRLLGVDVSAEEQRAVLSRVGVATEPAPAGTRVVVAGGPEPLEVDASESGRPRGDRPVLAPRPRDRGGCHRGSRPDPRLRAHPGHPAGHADAAVPAIAVAPSGHRARGPRRGGPVRGGVVRARVTGHGRALPGRRGPRHRRGGRHRRSSGHGDEPAVEPALRDAPAAVGQPPGGGRHESPPGPAGRRDLRDRQGVWGAGRRGRDPRVVAARLRPDRSGRDPRLEPTRPALRPRRRQGHHRPRGPLAGHAPAGVHAPHRRSVAPSRSGSERGRHGRDRGTRRRAPSGAHRRARVASGAGHRGGARRGRPVRGSAGGAARTDAVAPSGRGARPGRGRRRRPTGERGRGRHPPACGAVACVGRALRHLPRPATRRDERRSLAFRLVFAAADRTLTEEEVDRAVADVAEGLASDVDGHLRT